MLRSARPTSEAVGRSGIVVEKWMSSSANPDPSSMVRSSTKENGVSDWKPMKYAGRSNSLAEWSDYAMPRLD
jgi:hypothetical protein